MRILIFLFLAFSQNLVAQVVLPEISVTTVAISQGDQGGFVVDIPGLGPDDVLKHWKSFSHLLFPPIQPGDGQPQYPMTVEDDAVDHEYHTTGLYLPNLSQNTVEAYFLLKNVTESSENTTAAVPTTRLSLAIDFGNDYFLDTDNVVQTEVIKHLLYKFFVSMERSLSQNNKN